MVWDPKDALLYASSNIIHEIETAACTEYSTNVRLQPDISVTMQLRRKWAQRNHIEVKCRVKEPSLRVTCESMCSTTCSVALLNTKVCHMIALFPRPLFSVVLF